MPENNQTGSRATRIHSLTGLRFFAALTVVLVHSYQIRTGSYLLGPGATNAVTFFFVLSGFILTWVYHERIATIGTWKFYLARFARVWPLHVACFALFVWVNWYFAYENLFVADQAWQIASNLTLTQSWVPIEKWAMRFNGPSWSISTELGFYLLFPLLLFFSSRGFGLSLIHI